MPATTAPAIDPLYLRLGLITRSLHDTLAALRTGLDSQDGSLQAALRRRQPDDDCALHLAGGLLGQLERTEQDLLRLLADCRRKASLAQHPCAARRCVDELLAEGRHE